MPSSKSKAALPATLLTNDPDVDAEYSAGNALLGNGAVHYGTTEIIEHDPNLIAWDGPRDENMPRNWPDSKKWTATMIVAIYSLITTMSASIVAPAIGAMAKSFHIEQGTVTSQMFLSIYILAWTIGQLFLSPLSEIYGRVVVLQTSNLFFLVFNIACGFARSSSEMIIFRFLSGAGAGCAITLGAGVLSDTWARTESGKAIGIYALSPVLGPALGPILGGFITEAADWKCIFWASSIASATVQICGFLFLTETFAPKLLRRRAEKLRKITGNQDLYTDWERANASGFILFKNNVFRAFELLFTQPIIQVLAVYLAYLYGINFLVLSTFSKLYVTKYHQSTSEAALNYLFIAKGYVMGTSMAPLNGKLYNKLTARNGGVESPENRTLIMIPTSLLVPIGFLWYGWTAESPNASWWLPGLGAMIFSAGIIVNNQSIIAYLIDCYSEHAASAMAAALMWRCVAAFAFPLFAPALYNTLGYGWGCTLLAGIALGIGLPAPALLYKYGAVLRENSSYAASSKE